MTGLLWSQLFSATFKQQNLPFFRAESAGAEILRGAQAPPRSRRVQGLGPILSVNHPTNVSLSNTQTEARQRLKLSITFSQVRHKPSVRPRHIREDCDCREMAHYQRAIAHDTTAYRPPPCDSEHQQQRAHESTGTVSMRTGALSYPTLPMDGAISKLILSGRTNVTSMRRNRRTIVVFR